MMGDKMPKYNPNEPKCKHCTTRIMYQFTANPCSNCMNIESNGKEASYYE